MPVVNCDDLSRNVQKVRENAGKRQIRTILLRKLGTINDTMTPSNKRQQHNNIFINWRNTCLMNLPNNLSKEDY